ncbi:transposable element Tc1 transposase [Trichonephila clavipes]|nr:transposable element Tc1 transposase [Trichonephila clavipes]
MLSGKNKTLSVNLSGRPILRQAHVAAEMETLASESVAGISSARETGRCLDLPPFSECNILQGVLIEYIYKLQSCHKHLPSNTVQGGAFVSACVSGEDDFGKRNMPGKRARRHFSHLSEFERGLIIGMKTTGWSTRRVAGQVDRSELAVRNCWEQWIREGTYAWKTGKGATRKTTRRDDRRIVRHVLVDPTVIRSTIRVDVGEEIVPQTISRDLAQANLIPKRPFRALPLTPEHRQLRLQWCQARSMWNVTDWQKVVFSDESRFV